MMRYMVGRLRDFARNERAVTAIEYAIIAGLLSVLIVAAVTSIGKSTSSQFNKVSVSV